MAKEKLKPEIQPKPARFLTPLILTTIAFVVIGIIIFFAGRAIFGAILALFGAVLGLGSRIGESEL